jgi:hypothetical protein
MATIVNNNKYGEGHEVVLKSAAQIPILAKTAFGKYGFVAGVSTFKVSRTAKSAENIITIGTGKDSVFLVDDKGKTYQIVGKAATINGSFNHHGKNIKSKTNLLTEIKELISMWMFESYFESKKFIEEDEIFTRLGANKEYYDTVYYNSALKQLDALKPYVKGSGYTYERQGQNRTKQLYVNARKQTGRLNDNWNPADVWMIKKDFDMQALYTAAPAEVLNGMLAEAFKNGDVIPISLKQITGTAKVSIVDPSKLMTQKTDLDLSFKEIKLSSTFNNFFVVTKSKFAVRGGFKSSSASLIVSLEGTMLGAGYQLGGIDAKQFTKKIQDDYGYSLRGGVRINLNDMDKAKKEFKEIMTKYGNVSGKLESYDSAMEMIDRGDTLLKSRFIAIVSYLYAVVIKGQRDFEDLMKYCYFSAKKISSDTGTYLLIS